MTDPYLVSLLACVVVGVFYAALFAIFAAWTASARWRRNVQVFIELVIDWLLRWVSRVASRTVVGVRSRRQRRIRPVRKVRLGDISPANSMMTLLEVEVSADISTEVSADISARETRIDLPAMLPTSSAPASSASAFPLYTPPLTAPMPAISTMRTEERPQPEQKSEQKSEQKPEQKSEQKTQQKMGYLVYLPREGYIAPEWPPTPKQAPMGAYPSVLASGIIVRLEDLVLSEVVVPPWYADN